MTFTESVSDIEKEIKPVFSMIAAISSIGPKKTK